MGVVGSGGAVAVGSARELVDGLVSSGALDSLFERIDRDDVGLTGDGGLIPGLVRVALERGLEEEMTSHLGLCVDGREDKEASGMANSRNGSYPKTLATEVGPVAIQVPQDRDGSFTPRLVLKCSMRLGGLVVADRLLARLIVSEVRGTAAELSAECAKASIRLPASTIRSWVNRGGLRYGSDGKLT